MKEEIIIINGEPFYRIPNGTSCDYAPIPKEFKPYFEKLEEENKSLQSQLKEKEETINKAIKHVSSLSSKGRGCEIYADVKRDILEILSKGENK